MLDTRVDGRQRKLGIHPPYGFMRALQCILAFLVAGENPSNIDECVRICVDYVISIVSVLHLENAMNYRQWRYRRGNGLQSVLARCFGLAGVGPCALHPPCVL